MTHFQWAEMFNIWALRSVAEHTNSWYNVRRGEKTYISPFKSRAHVIIDSSLRYEVPVFAHYAGALRAAVEQVPEDNPRCREFHDLVDAFRYFEPVDPALVAPDSLIREFIGGGSYHY